MVKSLVNGHVKIESREGVRIEPTREFFGEKNTSVVHMDYGDYVFIPNKEPEKEVAMEVKQTWTDLFPSIVSKKLFKQVAGMVKEFDIHYLLIVGNPEEEILKNTIIKKKNPNHHWNYTMDNWDGAYTRLTQLTNVVFAYNWNHALQRMNLWFKKSTDGKTRLFNYIDKLENPCATFLNSKIGIGEVTAKLVTDELAVESLPDLLDINKADLKDIDGIGDCKADLVMKTIWGKNWVEGGVKI